MSATSHLPESAEVDDLVRGAQAGDDQAFNRLVRAFAGPMYNLAYRMTGNPADADDLAQEIFVKLHRSIRLFGWRSKFTTWLYALAANTCRSGLRRLRRVASREVASMDADPEHAAPEATDGGERPGEALAKSELRGQVEACIAALPAEFRLVIVMRDLQGLSYEEIAEAAGLSVGTVKSRLARARFRVRERLQRQGIAG